MFQGRLYASRLYAGKLFTPALAPIPVQVHQGGAHRGVRFVPTIDAEAVFAGAEGNFFTGQFAPSAAASADFFAHPVAASTAELFQARANGYAEFRTDASMFDSAPLVGEGSGCATFATDVHTLFAGSPSPTAEACAAFEPDDLVGEAGDFYPSGVRNPTEAELIAIIQSALDTQRVYM